MKKFLLAATLTITTAVLVTFFLHSPITQNKNSHVLRTGMTIDETIVHNDVSYTDNAAMSTYKGALFSELQVFRERA